MVGAYNTINTTAIITATTTTSPTTAIAAATITVAGEAAVQQTVPLPVQQPSPPCSGHPRSSCLAPRVRNVNARDERSELPKALGEAAAGAAFRELHVLKGSLRSYPPICLSIYVE